MSNPIHILTFSNEYIALWEYSPTIKSKDKQVFLTHGTYSNRKVFSAMVQFLNEAGYTCWVLEWRGHGKSTPTKSKYNFETIALEDIRLTFEYLFQEKNIQKLHCITHSGGGICLGICLVHFPHFKVKIQSITFFACQAFAAGEKRSSYYKIWLGKYISKVLGYVPARLVGGEENESFYFMNQWNDWNLTGDFLGINGIDYKVAFAEIKTPIFALSGGGDTFIAPPEGCKKLLNIFQNPSNKYLVCSKENGFLEDYNHSRILHSRNASREIYPLVLEWIKIKEDFDFKR